jgi:protein-L-isoaspartate(D-aspartate) O-methyltransferase
MAPRPIADSYGGYRARLVEELRGKGIKDMAVLAAIAETPRHLFVPEALRARAYDDTSLPVGQGQTISQPSTHAQYLVALDLKGRERVLEVGTGTGYQAALLGRLAEVVVSVERLPELAVRARKALEDSGTTNVTVLVGDGTLGWRPLAPYDAILVSASGPRVPSPLTDQLTDNGIMLIPLDRGTTQDLYRITKHGNELTEEKLAATQFVPLIGRHGFQPEAS